MTQRRSPHRLKPNCGRQRSSTVDALLAGVAERHSIRRAASDAAGTAAFRASVEQRLKSLEGDLAEVKSRLNGLLFLAAGTVLTQVVLHLLH